MAGEDDLLVSAVSEFCTRVIDNYSIGIERDGISRELVSKIAEQGFLGLTLPSEKGGAGVTAPTYLKMLKEFATHSPSVAVLIMSVNSIILPLLEKAADSAEIVPEVISGKMVPSIPINPDGASGYPVYSLSVSDGKITGEIPYVIGFGWESVIAGLDSGKGNLILIKSGTKVTREHSKLGLRGLSLCGVSVDSSDFTEFSTEGSREAFAGIFDTLNLETAAIALGISDGSLTKALEYAKVRSTFEHLLKDYQPVAFPLTRLLGEKEILERFLLHRDEFSEKEKIFAKIVSVDLAKNASRQSIQTHGGYGYLEDFGVEKFYRDSMALSVLFGNRITEQKKLSGIVFESESGYI